MFGALVNNMTVNLIGMDYKLIYQINGQTCREMIISSILVCANN